MSILETFYILFKSDADKAADGMERVEDAADKVESSLNKADRSIRATATGTAAAAASSRGLGTGMAGAAVGANATAAASGKIAATTALADANAKRLSMSFLSMARSAAAPLLALVSITGAINLATGRAAAIRELDQFSAKLNSTIADVDAFQRSVQGMGGEGAKALDSLVKIGEKVNEAFADADSGARKDFEGWGLAFKDAQGNALGATDAMLALAGSIETVSRAEGLARIKKLGIEDAATIELLLKGRKEVENFMNVQKQMGVVTEAQAETTREYYTALGALGNQLTSVGNGLVSALLPAITKGVQILSGAVDWMDKNRTLVEGFFIGIAGAVTAYFLPAMTRAALATVIATWPFLLMAFAIAGLAAAFALAYEDFQAWANGQPSVLGELLGDYETFVKNLEGLFEAFSWDNFLLDLKNIQGWLSDAFSVEGFMTDIENLKTSVISAFTSMGEAVSNTLGAAIQAAINLVAGIPNAVRAAVMAVLAVGGMEAGNPQAAKELGAAFGAAAAPQQPYADGAAPSWVKPGQPAPPTPAGNVRAGQTMLNGAAAAPQGLAMPPSTVNQTSTVNVGGVTVNTQATDAAGVAAAVKGELSNQLRGTAAAFDDGVDR